MAVNLFLNKYIGEIPVIETKDKIRMGNPNRKQVALYDLENNLIKVFDSLNECDDYLGLYRGSTSKVFRGICKTLKKKYIPKLI